MFSKLEKYLVLKYSFTKSHNLSMCTNYLFDKCNRCLSSAVVFTDYFSSAVVFTSYLKCFLVCNTIIISNAYCKCGCHICCNFSL